MELKQFCSRFRLRPRVRKQVEERHGFLRDSALGANDQAQEEPRGNARVFQRPRHGGPTFVSKLIVFGGDPNFWTIFGGELPGDNWFNRPLCGDEKPQ